MIGNPIGYPIGAEAGPGGLTTLLSLSVSAGTAVAISFAYGFAKTLEVAAVTVVSLTRGVATALAATSQTVVTLATIFTHPGQLIRRAGYVLQKLRVKQPTLGQ